MVALRKESVDRNFDAVQIIIVVVVALRKESVDRNIYVGVHKRIAVSSLSARRAWIEINIHLYHCTRKWGRSPQGERG